MKSWPLRDVNCAEILMLQSFYKLHVERLEIGKEEATVYIQLSKAFDFIDYQDNFLDFLFSFH